MEVGGLAGVLLGTNLMLFAVAFGLNGIQGELRKIRALMEARERRESGEPLGQGAEK